MSQETITISAQEASPLAVAKQHLAAKLRAKATRKEPRKSSTRHGSRVMEKLAPTSGDTSVRWV
ncbi:hypothetical protein E6H19_07335 [Candidatus Bathyarchaeota archaeon]|nr:MAG: hypothetical protein E6H19_07335 [Candidatus Bathyarchaeota archaeon]